MRKIIKFTKEQKEKIIDGYTSGISIEKIAKNYNVSNEIISKFLKNNNIQIRKNNFGYSITHKDKIIQMWNSGASHQEIKNILNIKTSASITRILKRFLPNYQGRRKERCNFWKGGKKIECRGYIKIKIDENDKYFCMTDSNNYIYEHRYVMAKYLDRPLLKNEQVHHINGNKSDNNIKNLQLVIGSHGSGQCYKCSDCDSRKIQPTELIKSEESYLWNLLENKSVQKFEFIKE